MQMSLKRDNIEPQKNKLLQNAELFSLLFEYRGSKVIILNHALQKRCL